MAATIDKMMDFMEFLHISAKKTRYQAGMNEPLKAELHSLFSFDIYPGASSETEYWS
ncbi:hypothetical protein ACLB1O_29920 [Escherichia coli]